MTSERYANLIDWVLRVNATRGDPEGPELVQVLDRLLRDARAEVVNEDGSVSAPTAPPTWQTAIEAACSPADQWMARRFIDKLVEHKRLFPAFKASRVAEIFIGATPKQRARYCYLPIESFTKSIRFANKMRSLADSQS